MACNKLRRSKYIHTLTKNTFLIYLNFFPLTITDQIPAQRQDTILAQQTPVVSAMSDAPSVEILPSLPQKAKSKKYDNPLLKKFK